ncbi:hypothetical protein CEV33_2294 [Brucella grignonensis]|uniref:Uncharacterized protein n=1 Tax=Brucella grignonensis TaxID=94627 RepID=A0A256F7P2_9HYPH|nr:hypothetical protein CEV33_2294 [Brucella grignonensis]
MDDFSAAHDFPRKIASTTFLDNQMLGSTVLQTRKCIFATCLEIDFHACQEIGIYCPRCVASLCKSDIHCAPILCKSMRSPPGSGSVSGTYTTFPIEIEQPEKLGRSRF